MTDLFFISPSILLEYFFNELSKRDFLLSYLLWHRVLIFTHNSFLAYNCGISFGRQNIMPNSNQTEFLQQSSFRKVFGKEEKKRCHGCKVLILPASSEFLCALFSAANWVVMCLTFSENSLTHENDIWHRKIPNLETQQEQTLLSHHCVIFYTAQSLAQSSHSKFC